MFVGAGDEEGVELMVVAILRGLIGGAFLLAGSYLLVLLTLGLGLLAMMIDGGHAWSTLAGLELLFYGLFAIVLIGVGWRMIRNLFLPPPS